MELALAASQPVSPLMLADHLLTLAEVADRAGFRKAASSLLSLVDAVLDDAGEALAPS